MWQPIETAQKDGTLLLLLVDYDGLGEEHPLEDVDSGKGGRTVGFNNFNNDGEDVWQIAGYCWSHEHFTEGRGAPRMWQQFPASPLPTD